MNPFINIEINQAIWFICVWGGNAGVLFALPLLVLNIILSPNKGAELRMIGFLELSII